MSFGISAKAAKNNTIIALFLFGIVILSILPMETVCPVLILLTGLTFGVFVMLVFAPEDFNFLFNYFSIALGIRAFLSYLFYIASFALVGDIKYPNLEGWMSGESSRAGFLFLNDGYAYSQQGWQICKLAEKGIKITRENFITDPNMINAHWSGNVTSYDFFTAHVYSITGHSPLSMFFISSVAGALSGIFIYLLAKEIFSRRIAKAASIFAFFWPSFIMWSTQNMKEPMITMLVGIILWAALYAHRHASVGFGILSAIAALLFFQISAPLAIITISAILISLALLFLRSFLKSKRVTLFTLVIITAALLLVFQDRIFEMMLNKAQYSIAHSGGATIFDFLNYNRQVRAQGNLQIMGGFSISSPIKALVFAPIGFIYALFAPFPWQIGSVNQIIAIPETIIFYILISATARGFILAYKRRFWPAVFLISIILAQLGFLALIEGNSGTLFRHRAAAFYLLFIFTAAGLAVKKKEKKLIGLIRDIK